MTNIDRRISKTKKAIYQAFIQLLNAKGYEATTVQDIIDLADVGRSTFYCHYESKELLLDQLCRYLFHHIFEREQAISTENYLAHLFLHFHKNQDHITSLLFSKNDYFLRQLHKELEHHVYSVLADNLKEAHPNLPTSLPPTLGHVQLYRDIDLVAQKRSRFHRPGSCPILSRPSHS